MLVLQPPLPVKLIITLIPLCPHFTSCQTGPVEAETAAPSIGLDSLPVRALDRISLAAGLTKETGRSLFAILGPKMLERLALKVFQTVEMSEANAEQIARFFLAKVSRMDSSAGMPERRTTAADPSPIPSPLDIHTSASELKREGPRP